jgi:hypothetical protein
VDGSVWLMVFLCVTTLSRMDQDVRSCRSSQFATAGGPCEDPDE